MDMEPMVRRRQSMAREHSSNPPGQLDQRQLHCRLGINQIPAGKTRVVKGPSDQQLTKKINYKKNKKASTRDQK